MKIKTLIFILTSTLALPAISAFGDSDEIERLTALSTSPKYETAVTALDSLQALQSLKATDVIAGAAESHPVLAVRVSAIRSLSANPNYEHYSDRIRAMLKDSSDQMKVEAAGALGFHGDGSGKDVVLEVLSRSKDNSKERHSALRAASLIGDSRTLPVLRSIQKREAPEGDLIRTIETIEFKQLTTDKDRMDFLRRSLTKREGNINRWARIEVQQRAKLVPQYLDLLKEAGGKK